MAIFASTTTSGYSDPMKAMSIKALEARQKELAGLKGDAITPDNTQTPMQGIGHVMNQLADGLNQGRNMAAVAERRAELARVMAHMDPNNPTQADIAAIHSADPELGAKIMQQVFEAREQKERLAHADKAQQAGFQHADQSQQAGFRHADTTKQGEYAHADQSQERVFQHSDQSQERVFQHGDQAAAAKVEADKAAAAEAARVAETAAVKADERTQAHPQSPTGKEIADIEKMPEGPEKELARSVLRQQAAPKPDQVKAQTEADKAVVGQDVVLSDMERADKALGEGINTGPTKGFKTGVAEITGGYIGDLPKAQRTELVDSVMEKIATAATKQALPGAISNYEGQKFSKIYNNPNFSDDDRRAAFKTFLEATRQEREIASQAAKKLGGTGAGLSGVEQKPSATGAQPTAAAASPQDAEALAWANANPTDPRAAKIHQRLGK